MTQHWIDRLSDYVDGELPQEEGAALEQHVADCGECAAALADLRAVVARARELPVRAPEADLWAGIESRLEVPERVVARPLRASGWTWPRFSFSFGQLAGAAAALVLVSVAGTWFALGGRQAPTKSEPVAIVRPETASIASFDERRYARAIDELQSALQQHRSELDTTTVRVLEENLAIIDRATEEARRALAADPGNTYLNGHLAEQYQKKIKLLQRATSVMATQG